MGKRKYTQKQQRRINIISFLIGFVLTMAFMGYIFKDEIKEFINESKTVEVVPEAIGKEGSINIDDIPKETKPETPEVQGEAKVTFIDVGQGDSILIQYGAKNILIDSGTSGNASKVMSVLDSNGVKTIDILVASHPHADHIGSMSQIVDAYKIGKVYMPDTGKNAPTSAAYGKLLRSIDAKGLGIVVPSQGDYLINEGGVSLQVLNDFQTSGEKSKNLNEYSIGLNFEFKNINFVFTGDGEKLVEANIMELNPSLTADVFKSGHHGANNANTDAFVKQLKPSIVVIQVGEDNRYGHPTDVVLRRFKDIGAQVYRTDVDGDVVITTDGNTVIKE